MSDLTREQVVDYLSNLPIMEISKLVKDLEEQWGVSAAPVTLPGVPQQEAPKEEAQTEFDVILTAISNKMATIKAIRGLNSDLGLKEAKDASENLPFKLLEGVGKEAADAAKAAFGDNATVEIK